MTRYYIDLEFDSNTLGMISIGIVSQTGRQLYAVNTDFEWTGCDPWLHENVKPHLMTPFDKSGVGLYGILGGRSHIAREIDSWIGDDDPEFWAYYGDHDWVIFCQMFGGMLSLPSRWPKLCLDIKQAAMSMGIRGSLKDVVPQKGTIHNALDDALWNQFVHSQMIMQYGREM